MGGGRGGGGETHHPKQWIKCSFAEDRTLHRTVLVILQPCIYLKRFGPDMHTWQILNCIKWLIVKVDRESCYCA